MIHNNFRRIALAQGLLPQGRVPSPVPLGALPDGDSRPYSTLSDRRATGPITGREHAYPQTGHSAAGPQPPSP